jgi:hypothetical protein
MGWSVNVQTGELVLYQDLPDLNLTVQTSRANLLSYAPLNLNLVTKEQLRNMEAFWKLSLKAIAAVKNDPKEEGNICEIKDKCGNKFLAAVNRVQNPVYGNTSSSVTNFNTRYSIVVVKC